MRNWSKLFHPYLCYKHSNALWNERWIMYRAVVFDRKGWRNHPETKQFENCPEVLWDLQMDLMGVRLAQGYTANIPDGLYRIERGGEFIPYKSESEQLADLILKNCDCDTVAIWEEVKKWRLQET